MLFLLIPPILVILCVANKVAAIPGITLGIVLGAICGFIFQGINLGQLMVSAYSGYVSNTGNSIIDELLTTGGIMYDVFNFSYYFIYDVRWGNGKNQLTPSCCGNIA